MIREVIFWKQLLSISVRIHLRSSVNTSTHKREGYDEFWSSWSRNQVSPLSLSFSPSVNLSNSFFHSSSHSVAIETKLDKTILISATRERLVWAKVLLVFCGEDFWSLEPSQDAERLLCDSNSTSSTPRLFQWSPLQFLPPFLRYLELQKKKARINLLIYHIQSELGQKRSQLCRWQDSCECGITYRMYPEKGFPGF